MRVISSTRWEVNITRKYRMASLAMTSKRLGNPSPGIFDFFAKKITSENARQSEVCIYSAGSAVWRFEMISHTVKERDTRIHEMVDSMRDKHTQVICVKWYRREWLGYRSIVAARRLGPMNKNFLSESPTLPPPFTVRTKIYIPNVNWRVAITANPIAVGICFNVTAYILQQHSH